MNNLKILLEKLTKFYQTLLINKYFSKIFFIIIQLLLFVYILGVTSIIYSTFHVFLYKNLLITLEQSAQYGFYLFFFFSFYLFTSFKILNLGSYFKKYPLRLLYITLFIFHFSDIFNFFLVTRWEWFLSIFFSILVYLGFTRTKANLNKQKLDKFVLSLLSLFVILFPFLSYSLILFATKNDIYSFKSYENMSSFVLVNVIGFFTAPILEELAFRGFLIRKKEQKKLTNTYLEPLRQFSLIFFFVNLFFTLPSLLMNYLQPVYTSYLDNGIIPSASLNFLYLKTVNLYSDYNRLQFYIVTNEYLGILGDFLNSHLALFLIPFVISLIIFTIFSFQKSRTFLVIIKNFLITKSKFLAKIYHIMSWPFFDFYVNRNNKFMYAISTINFVLIHLKWHDIFNTDQYYDSNYILFSNLNILLTLIGALFMLWFRIRVNLSSAIAVHSLYNVTVMFVTVNFISNIKSIEYNSYMIALMFINIFVIVWFLVCKFYFSKELEEKNLS